MIYIRNRNTYVNNTLQNILSVEYINSFHSMTITPDFVDQKEIHDFWELVYIESGEALITSDDEKIPAFAGNMFFHKPGEVHAIEAANGSNVQAYFITFFSSSEITKLFDSLRIRVKHEQKEMLRNIYNEATTLYVNKLKKNGQYGFLFQSA